MSWAGKLWDLSKSHQVLCVTHLPQIACYADHHVKVAKLASRDRTVTSVEVLDRDARVTETQSDAWLGKRRNPRQRRGDVAPDWKLEGEHNGAPSDQRHLNLRLFRGVVVRRRFKLGHDHEQAQGPAVHESSDAVVHFLRPVEPNYCRDYCS